MNPLHLIWIIPVCTLAGGVLMALAAASGRNGNGGGNRSYKQSSGFSTSFEREYKRTSDENATYQYSQETVETEKNATLYGKIEF